MDQDFERFRDFLRLLARLHMGAPLRARVDASDIVQETLIDAHKGRAQFKGKSDAELMAWLRAILVHNLADIKKAQDRVKRGRGREQSLDRELGRTTVKLGDWMAAHGSSPSRRLSREEEILRLASAMARLPDPQREAVELHHLKGMKLKELATHLRRSEEAAAALIHRGLERLRELLEERETA